LFCSTILLWSIILFLIFQFFHIIFQPIHDKKIYIILPNKNNIPFSTISVFCFSSIITPKFCINYTPFLFFLTSLLCGCYL
jgi:hypothetical protein